MSSTSLPLSTYLSLSPSLSLTRLLMTWQPRAYRQTTSEGLASPTSERRPSSGIKKRGNPFIQPSFGTMEERLGGTERKGRRDGEGERREGEREREGGTEREGKEKGGKKGEEGRREKSKDEPRLKTLYILYCIDESRCMF